MSEQSSNRDEGDIFDDVESLDSVRPTAPLPAAAPPLGSTALRESKPVEPPAKTTVVVMSHLSVKEAAPAKAQTL